MDNHGKKVKIEPGQMMCTFRDLANKFEVDKGVIERLFSKLQQEGIVGIKTHECKKKPRQEKTVFFLEKKYMVTKKTETRNDKTETRKIDDLPRQNENENEKTETQLYMQLQSSSLNVYLKDAVVCARGMGESSQVKELPKMPLVQTDKEKEKKKETKNQTEQIETFILWAESYGRKFERDSVSYWIRFFGFDSLSSEFNNMISEKRKIPIRNIHGWITNALKNKYVPEQKIIEENISWTNNLIKKKGICYIKTTKRYCIFNHISYNDTIYFNRNDFRKYVEEKIDMLQERIGG